MTTCHKLVKLWDNPNGTETWICSDERCEVEQEVLPPGGEVFTPTVKYIKYRTDFCHSLSYVPNDLVLGLSSKTGTGHNFK